MSGNTTRNIVVATRAVLVCAAVGLNWKYSGQEAAQQAEETGTKILGEAALVSGQDGENLAENTVYEGDDYFASARLTRQQARDSALELLQKAAADEKADQAMVDEANASIQAMAACTMSEAQVENLVTAKGYGDCVCFIGDGSVSVVVSATEGGLSETDIAKIMEIVQEETGLSAQRIKIIEAEP